MSTNTRIFLPFGILLLCVCLSIQSLFSQLEWQFQAGLQYPMLQIQDGFNSKKYLIKTDGTSNDKDYLVNDSGSPTTHYVAIKLQNRFGFYAGFRFKIPISSVLKISSGLLFPYQESYREYSSYIEDKAIPTDILRGEETAGTFKSLYLSLPLSLDYQLNKGNKNFFIGGGIYYHLKIIGHENRRTFKYRLFKITTEYDFACHCANITSKTPIQEENLREEKIPYFEPHGIGFIANMGLSWLLKNGKQIGFTYALKQDISSFFRNASSSPSFDGNFRYLNHQIGLAYQFHKSKIKKKEGNPNDVFFLGLGVYPFLHHNKEWSIGPSLDLGYFFNDGFGINTTAFQLRGIKSNIPFRGIGIDFNLLFKPTPVFYFKLGTTILNNNLYDSDGGDIGGIAPQFGIGFLFPSIAALKFKMEYHQKLWLTSHADKKWTPGANIGLLYELK